MQHTIGNGSVRTSDGHRVGSSSHVLHEAHVQFFGALANVRRGVDERHGFDCQREQQHTETEGDRAHNVWVHDGGDAVVNADATSDKEDADATDQRPNISLGSIAIRMVLVGLSQRARDSYARQVSRTLMNSERVSE